MKLKHYIKKPTGGGDVFKMLFDDLNGLKRFKNVLLVRTPTTAEWMNDWLSNESSMNIVRLMYNSIPENKLNKKYITENPSYTHIEHHEMDNYLKDLNIKFDAVCLDPFHEYQESSSDFKICSSYLSDNGILICHDCYPPQLEHCTKQFQIGCWSGLTYLCFIELAYNNPQWHYSIITNDTGLGIMSKNIIEDLTNDTAFDRQKQETLISLKEDDAAAYHYFMEHRDSLMKMI